MHIDPRQRFTSTVSAYRLHRPGYPEALIDWILAGDPVTTVVDLGAGTGLSSRALSARGVSVIGVEPNTAMRAAAEAEGGARYVPGDAERTGLPDAIADRVVSGQAFHWFDLDRTLPEVARLLRPGGRATAFWNLRGSDPVMDDYEVLLRRACSPYALQRGPRATLADLRARLPERTEARFPHVQRLDRAGLQGRTWSSSYLERGITDVPLFDRALDALFHDHATDGHITFLYETVAIGWSPNGPAT